MAYYSNNFKIIKYKVFQDPVWGLSILPQDHRMVVFPVCAHGVRPWASKEEEEEPIMTTDHGICPFAPVTVW